MHHSVPREWLFHLTLNPVGRSQVVTTHETSLHPLAALLYPGELYLLPRK